MKISTINDYLAEISAKKPLILNITNEVTIQNVANIETLLGASPIMSNNINDCLELLKIAKSIIINLGTLNPLQVKIAKKICPIAKTQNIPIILDIVGYGATISRNKVFDKLIPYATLIKGNGSEILSLYHQKKLSRGIDATIDTKSKNYSNLVKSLAQKFQCLVMMTGSIDYLSDGNNSCTNNYGNPLMTKIVGTGCILNGVIAVFIDSQKLLESITAALTFYTITADPNNNQYNTLNNFQKHWYLNMELFLNKSFT